MPQTAAAARCRSWRRPDGADVGAASSRSPSSSRASPMCCRRVFGSRLKHRRSTRRTPAGVSLGSAFHLTSARRTAASVSETVSPLKSFRPESVSWSTTPNAQISARRSTGLPRACSGLMYAAVPMTVPTAVPLVRVGECEELPCATDCVCNALARPKSKIFGVPSGVILRFAGFKSRWMTPLSCAVSSPSAIATNKGRASSMGRPARDALGELHDEESLAVRFFEPVKRRDVRVI